VKYKLVFGFIVLVAVLVVGYLFWGGSKVWSQRVSSEQVEQLQVAALEQNMCANLSTGELVEVGETVKSWDGCNTCSCGELFGKPSMLCTGIGCGSFKSKLYQLFN